MRNLKNIFALFILLVASVSMYSCDSDAIIDDTQSEKIDDYSKTGEEENSTVERDG